MLGDWVLTRVVLKSFSLLCVTVLHAKNCFIVLLDLDNIMISFDL